MAFTGGLCVIRLGLKAGFLHFKMLAGSSLIIVFHHSIIALINIIFEGGVIWTSMNEFLLVLNTQMPSRALLVVFFVDDILLSAHVVR